MKIFISWSGDRSRVAAVALRKWLRRVIHATDPWMSKEDIPPGEIWFGAINDSIEQSKYGIICVTERNQFRPWLLWEAGALYRGFNDARRVVPFLIDLKKSQLEDPLRNFQVIEASDKEEVLRMLKSINAETPKPIDKEDLSHQFELYWDELQDKLAQAIADYPEPTGGESTCKYKFQEAAARFLKEPGKQKTSTERDRYALEVAAPYINDLSLDQVSDETLREFKADRLAGTLRSYFKGKEPKAAAPTTLNKELRTIGAVLNRAVNDWGWIPYAPRLTKETVRHKREPYIIDAQTQANLFSKLPSYVMRAALFAVNTGVRRGIIYDLEWKWMRHPSEIEYPVLLVPKGYRGAKYSRTIMLNSISNRIIEAQQGLHDKYVFVGKRGGQFSYGKAWATAWERAGLPMSEGYLRGVENLRYTFEHRLINAGVPKEDRDLLMWITEALAAHLTTEYDYEHMLDCVEKITSMDFSDLILNI